MHVFYLFNKNLINNFKKKIIILTEYKIFKFDYLYNYFKIYLNNP